MRRLIGFSPRRSCHGATDEVKSYGMMLPAAVCGHTALRGVSILDVGLHAIMPPNLTPPSSAQSTESTSPKVEAMCGIQKNPCGI